MLTAAGPAYATAEALAGRRPTVPRSVEGLSSQAQPSHLLEVGSKYTGKGRALVPPPVAATVISRQGRSRSPHQIPASSDSRIPGTRNSAMIAASWRCAKFLPAHVCSSAASSAAVNTGASLSVAFGGQTTTPTPWPLQTGSGCLPANLQSSLLTNLVHLLVHARRSGARHIASSS